MKCFILQALIVVLFNQNWQKTFALNFNSPYFLILDAEPQGQNILIKTDACTSGGYTNVAIRLKKFCATGFWILISEWCGNENGQQYFVAARDSCFEIPNTQEIRVKRFMPILQQMSDFEGQAYAWRDEAAYFVHFNDTDKTILKPIDGPNKNWHIMTINQKLYGKYLLESVQVDKNTSQQCYSSENNNGVFQFYKLWSAGDRSSDSIFQVTTGQRQCKSGFTTTPTQYSRMTGVIYWNLGSKTPLLNSTSSFMHTKLRTNQIVTPTLGGRQSSQCNDNSKSLPYNNTLAEEQVSEQKYPKFPHQLPSSDVDNMITDEIQETTLKYMNYQLHNTGVPKINLPEYGLLRKSSDILEKYCCNPGITNGTMRSFQILLHFTLLYYSDYFGYHELKEPGQDKRILQALESCATRQEPKEPHNCISVTGTKDCYDSVRFRVNYTTWNETTYMYQMPEDLEYEEGNIDYVLETAWKSMLFVHYFCSSFFTNPSDHSAFNVKIESFFNPVMRTKWSRPQNAHQVYQLLLTGVNLKKFGEIVDACVDTAHQISTYEKWLSRPDVEIVTRRKRDVDGGCVPKNVPKVFCLEKQFDMIDNNLVYPKISSGECYNSYQNRGKYKYIHSSKYGTSY